MPERKIAGDALAETITTDIMDPDEAIRWVREQLAANLGTQGDEGQVGWFNAQIGTPRWQSTACAVYEDEAR